MAWQTDPVGDAAPNCAQLGATFHLGAGLMSRADQKARWGSARAYLVGQLLIVTRMRAATTHAGATATSRRSARSAGEPDQVRPVIPPRSSPSALTP